MLKSNGFKSINGLLKKLPVLLFLLVSLLMGGKSWGQISQGFESGMPTSYTGTAASSSVGADVGTATVLGTETWKLGDVIRGTYIHGGSYSAQIHSATGACLSTPVITNGVGTVTFWAGASSNSSAGVQLQISTDGGSNYTQVGSTYTQATTFSVANTLYQITAVINNPGTNIRLRWYRTASTIYIDDVVTTTYSAGTNYYLKANTDPTVAANWGTNTAGTTGTPSAINITNAIWNVTQNSNTPTTAWANAWTLGSGSSINVNASSTFNIAGTLDLGSQQISAVGASATIATTSNGYIKTANTNGFSGSSSTSISSTNSPTVTLTGSTVEYNNASSSQTITTATTYNNLKLSGAGGTSFAAANLGTIGAPINLATGTVTVSAGSTILNTSASAAQFIQVGSFSISGGTLNGCNSTYIGIATYLFVTNSFSQTGGLMTTTGSGGSNLVFSGGGSTTYSTNFSDFTGSIWWLYQISNNTTLTPSSNIYIDWSPSPTVNALTIDAGSSLVLGTNLVSFHRTSNIVTINGTLNTTNLNGISGSTSTSIVSTNSPTVTINTGSKINYAATSGTQTITAGTYYGLTISGGSAKTLAGATTVNTTLTLTSGIVTSSSSNTLTLASGATVTGYSSASYVNGPLTETFTTTTAATFPVGKSSNYRPVTFTYASTPSSRTVTIEQFETSNPLTIGSASTARFGSRYWNIAQSATGVAYTVGLNNGGNTPTGTVTILRREGTGSTSSNATSFSTPTYSNSSTFSTGNVSNDVCLVESAIPLTISGVTASNKAYDGTNAATSLLVTGSAALSGVVSGDVVTLSTGSATATFADKAVANGKTVTTAGFSLTGTNASAYSLTQPTTTANITAKSLTVTATGINKSYDGTNTATVTFGDNRVAGDVLTATATTKTFSDANVANGKTVSVSGISISGTDASNYSLSATTASTTANITGATLTVTAVNTNKTYGATLTSGSGFGTPTYFTYSALQNGESLGTNPTVTLTYGTGSAAAAAVNTYSSSAIVPSALTLGSSSTATLGNYSIGYTNANIIVDKATITVTANDQNSVIYGSAASTVTGAGSVNYTGFVNSENSGVITGTPTYSTNYTSGTAVGASGITITPIVTGLTATNYSFSAVSGNISVINASTPTISTTGTLSAVNTTYGSASATPTSFSLSGSALTAGVLITPPSGFEVSTTSNFSSNVGNNGAPITVGSAGTLSSTTIYVRLQSTATFAGSPYSGNIVLTSSGATTVDVATASSTVSKYGLTISGLSGVNKQYDATTSASLTGTATLSSTVNSDVITLDGSGASSSFATASVANGKTITTTGYTISGTNSSSYSLSQPTATANITPIALTLNGAAATSKTYDATNAATITGTLSGILSADNGNVTLVGTGTFASTGVANGISVTSTATLTGSAASNYTLTQPTGLTADITAKALTLTSAAATSKTYDATNAATITGTLSGILSADIGNVTLSGTGTFAQTGIGTGIAVNCTATLTGSASGNYTLTHPTGLTANITAKALTVTGAAATSKPYDRTNAAVITGTLSGVITADIGNVTLNGTGTFAQTGFGTGIAVTSTSTLGGTAAGNYSLTQPTGLTADITKVTLTVSGISTITKTYDGTNAATYNGTLNGIVSGDGSNVSLSGTGTYSSVNVGSGISVTSTASLTGTAASNYSLTQPTGLTGNITAASQSISLASTNTVLSNAADYSLGATSATSGVNTITYLSSDNNVATISVGGTVHVAGVGSCTITVSQASSTNYNATSATQTLTVTQAPVITATPTALAAFVKSPGTASTPQAFTVTGSTLSADISLAALSGYEYCLTVGGTYTSTLTLTKTGSAVNTVVYVRIPSTAVNGTYSGNLVLSSTNATSVNVAVTGTVSTSTSTIANWTFETNAPATGTKANSGTISPETGSGTFSIVHASASTIYSTQAGNGSAAAQSADHWATNDYIQFQISTTNLSNIKLTWDQSGSNTGPKDFQIQYSTNGSSFTAVGGSSNFYTVAGYGTCCINSSWTAATPNTSYNLSSDLSSITAINNQSTVYIRLVQYDNTGLNGSVVATGGTVRIDNISITGSATSAFIAAGGGPISSLSTTYGTASSTTSFTLTGSGLGGNNITVGPLTGFEFSSGGAYSSTLTGDSATGPTTINVRLAATTAVGTYSGNIPCTSTNGGTVTSLNVPMAVSTVTKATPAVTPTIGTYTYSGVSQGPNAVTTTPTSTGTVTYSYSGTGSTSYGPSATAPTLAGTYTVTASVTSDANNNANTSSATAFTIGLATPTVTVTPGTYTYTGSAQGPGASVTTNSGTGSSYTFSYVGVSGTTYSSSSTAPTNAGSYTVTASVAANGNYGSSSSSATAFTIGLATPTVTVTPGTYTYTGSAQGPGASVTTNSGTSSSYTFSYVGVSGTTYSASATLPTVAGSYTATASVAANGNYGAASSSATGFTISKASSTITATGTTSYTYTGLPQGPASYTSLSGSGGAITYSYSGTGSTSYGASSTKPTLIGTYQVIATVAADANYNSASSSALAFSINAGTPGTWLGTYSINYTDAQNWADGVVPTSGENVTIPGGTTYSPTVSGTTGTSTIYLTGGTLTINGSISSGTTFSSTPSSSLVLGSAAAGSTITFAGTTDSVTNGIGNLTVNGSVTLGSTIHVYGLVTVGTGVTFDVNHQHLVLHSDATYGTAAIGPVNDGSHGTISNADNVSVQRFHANKRSWILMSAPLTMSGITRTTSFNGSIFNNWQKQTYITAPPSIANPSTNGLDAATNNTYGMLRWIGTGWGRVLNTMNDTSLIGNHGGTLADNNPFFLFVRGDRSIAPTAGGTSSTYVTLQASGAFQSGTKTFDISGSTTYGLVANPYPAPIDLTSFIGDNTGLNTGGNVYFYYWDPNNSTTGGYTTAIYNSGSWSYSGRNTNTPNTIALAHYIQSGQAFFVTTNGQSTATFNETQKSTGSSTNAVFGNSSTATINVDLSKGTNYIDGAMTMYNNNYSAAVVAPTEDGYKFWGNEEGVAITRTATNLSVEARPEIAGVDTTFLYMNKMVAGNTYTFNISANNMSSNVTGVLVDKYLNKSTALDLTASTSVNFTVDTAAAAKSATRFMIVFNAKAPLYVSDIKIKASVKAKAALVEWSVATEKDVKSYTLEHSTTAKDFVTINTTAAKNISNSNYSYTDNSAVTGDNYYRIKAINLDGTIQYSSIAKVTIGDRREGISIYPNPIVGKTMNVQLSNIAAGTYALSMINANGQQVMEQSLQHAGGSVTSTVQLPSTIASGVYQLRLASNGKSYTETVIVK